MKTQLIVLLAIIFVITSCTPNQKNKNVVDAYLSNGTNVPPPIIHVTDLFRPFVDDDDHFDLAFQYALSYKNLIDLKGLILDRSQGGNRNPDVLSVAQLNYITNKAIPVSVGIQNRIKSNEELNKTLKMKPISGVQMVLDILERSSEPVYIHITGTCRDIAVAGTMKPELFRKKCKGIYMNMGVSTNDTVEQRRLDYNVQLDPFAYRLIWDIPCPIFWMPIGDRWEEAWQIRKNIKISQNATFYRISQRMVLPYLSEKMKKYFLFMFNKNTTSDWLSYLEEGEIDSTQFAKICERVDEKWCTAGFLDAAGKTVLKTGKLADKSENGIFTFKPIKISCDEQSRTTWQLSDKSTGRYIFHINDMENYQNAMEAAVKNLIKELP